VFIEKMAANASSPGIYRQDFCLFFSLAEAILNALVKNEFQKILLAEAPSLGDQK
jgi:hypothetical protein